MSNPNADEMEKAEGSRETVNANLEQTDAAQHRFEDADRGPGSDQKGGGITNRPLSREIEEQQQLPPRGKTKEDAEDRQ